MENDASALLPAGITDVLPPDAEFEAQQLERLISVFGGYGYERVKPPLIEFEETLLSGLGTAVVQDTFRLMDPISQRMMAVRADMTPQMARIATTRLSGAERPLRLSYAGQIIRVRGSQARPERQFAQVGAELIGIDTPQADAEVIAMAVEALEGLGIGNISVDLAMPTLVPAYCESQGLSSQAQAELRDALDRKDAATVNGLAETIGKQPAETLAALLLASGPADETLAVLSKLDLGSAGTHERDALVAVIDALRAQMPDINLTIDAVENRGFEYHTGVTFSFFNRHVRGELGRGGRYMAGVNDGEKEPATGLTLFMDTILKALPREVDKKRIYVPYETAQPKAAQMRQEGWVVIAGLRPVEDMHSEAKRLGCTHLYDTDKIVEIE